MKPAQETPRIRLLSALLCCGGAGYLVIVAALLTPLTLDSAPALIPGPFLIALGLFGAGRSKS
jgi:hypothetical protein